MSLYENMHSETYIGYYGFSDTISNKVSSTNATYIPAYMQDKRREV